MILETNLFFENYLHNLFISYMREISSKTNNFVYKKKCIELTLNI